jgi:hypothetical protein
MTISEAIDRFGDPAKQAVISELQQLIRLNVFKFHDSNLLTPKQLKARIPSKTLVDQNVSQTDYLIKLRHDLSGVGIGKRDTYISRMIHYHQQYRSLGYLSSPL